jgi:hypothetical protein
MLTFILLNDSEKPIKTLEGSWTIVIDGKELDNSGIIFGNGPGPVGGWGTLNPGNHMNLGRDSNSADIFRRNRNTACFGRAKGSEALRLQ